MNALTEQIQNRYRLERQLARTRQMQVQTDAALRQAKFDCRKKNAALVEYEGSLRSFLDKLSGKREERSEALRWEAVHAEESERRLKQESEAHAHTLSKTEAELNSFPSREKLKSAAAADPETAEYWAAQELLLVAETLLPLLEETLEALEECRRELRGENTGQLRSREDAVQSLSAHVTPGKACGELLTEMEKAMAVRKQSFGIPEYFKNPAGYLAAAARHNQLDRTNEALAQAEKMKKQIKALLEALE